MLKRAYISIATAIMMVVGGISVVKCCYGRCGWGYMGLWDKYEHGVV